MIHFFIIATLVVGLLVGSFLSVVVYRLPKILLAEWEHQCQLHLDLTPTTPAEQLSLCFPRSRCVKCASPIRWWHNIPVFSYFILRGRCHGCHDKISWQYPCVELGTCLLSGFLAWHFGPSIQLIAALIFTWFLIPSLLIDLEHQLLPDVLTLPLLWLGLLFNLNHTFVSLNAAVIGAVAGYTSFFIIYWIFKWITGKEGLGYGDFKLLAALGAWIGWLYLPMLVLMAGILGLIHAVSLKYFQGKDLKQPMPFGPSLVLAGWIMLVWGHSMLSTYLQWILK